MLTLDSEINSKYRKLRNYLKKNKVKEAKLLMDDGTILTYHQSSLIDLLKKNMIEGSYLKHSQKTKGERV